jgi:hypothetical protein
MAQQPPPPILYVDAPSFVNVSTEFDIIIRISDVPDGFGLIQVLVNLQFDPNDLEYIECEFLVDDPTGGWQGTAGCGQVSAIAYGPHWTEDSAWWRYRFHCLRAGPAPITFSSQLSIQDLSGTPNFVFYPEITVIIDQVEPAPVGGVASPINKLEILAPYLALAGLIIAVSTIYVIKRRKD